MNRENDEKVELNKTEMWEGTKLAKVRRAGRVRVRQATGKLRQRRECERNSFRTMIMKDLKREMCEGGREEKEGYR